MLFKVSRYLNTPKGYSVKSKSNTNNTIRLLFQLKRIKCTVQSYVEQDGSENFMTPGQGFLKQSIMVMCILNPEKDDEVNIDRSQNVRYDVGTRTR